MAGAEKLCRSPVAETKPGLEQRFLQCRDGKCAQREDGLSFNNSRRLMRLKFRSPVREFMNTPLAQLGGHEIRQSWKSYKQTAKQFLPRVQVSRVSHPDARSRREHSLQMSSRRMIICITFVERMGKGSVLVCCSEYHVAAVQWFHCSSERE